MTYPRFNMTETVHILHEGPFDYESLYFDCSSVPMINVTMHPFLFRKYIDMEQATSHWSDE